MEMATIEYSPKFKTTISLYITADEADRLDVLAEFASISRSRLIAELIQLVVKDGDKSTDNMVQQSLRGKINE